MIKPSSHVWSLLGIKKQTLNEVLRAAREDWGGTVHEEKQKIKCDFNLEGGDKKKKS